MDAAKELPNTAMRALILAALLASSLAHVAGSAAPRRSLSVDVFPAGPRSEPGVCWESLLTLCLCKHDLLASSLTGSPVPRACCRAAADVDIQCGPFTRAFVGSLLPREVLLQCAASSGAHPNARAPPRVPSAAPAVASPRVSGGARPPPPPGPEAYTSVRSGPPPRATNVSGGTRAPPKPKAHADLPEPNFPPRSPAAPYEKSFYLPPPYPETASGGTHTTSSSARRPRPPRAPKARADLPEPNFPPRSPAAPYEMSFYLPPPYPEQRASGGTRTTSPSVRRPPPPRAPKARADLPEPNFPPRSPAAPYEMSFYLPPPYPEQSASGGTHMTPPSVRRPPPPIAQKAAPGTGTHDAVVAGAHEPQVRGALAAAVPAHGGASGSEAPN